jgi:hypothetical protein
MIPKDFFDAGEIDALAELYRLVRYESRRKAKRFLHETGLTHCTGEQLDAVLDLIAGHPGYQSKIADAAEAMQAAKMQGQRQGQRDAAGPGGDLPEWLIGETSHWGRTFIIHFCPGGSWSFAGEIFDPDSPPPPDLESYPLDGGQILSNITWLEDRPPEPECAILMEEARLHLRIYDQGTES